MTATSIVSFELALLLNKAGYGSAPVQYYNVYNKHTFTLKANIHSEAVLAPTYQEVLDWLKVYDLHPECTETAIYQAVKSVIGTRL